MFPETTVSRGRVVAAKDSGAFARAPITTLLPPPIVAGPVADRELELELAQQIEQARAEGYQAGKLDASAGPMLELERQRVAAVATTCAAIAEAAERLAADRRRLTEEMTAEVADLAFAVIEAVVGANLAGEAELPARLRAALSVVPSDEAIVVRIHPEAEIDEESIREMVDTQAVAVVTDAAIEPGGCVVEAGASRIDSQISTVLERVDRVFAVLRSRKEGPRR